MAKLLQTRLKPIFVYLPKRISIERLFKTNLETLFGQHYSLHEKKGKSHEKYFPKEKKFHFDLIELKFSITNMPTSLNDN